MTVLGLMLLFLLTSTAILEFFGITLDSFRMAGGILLLLIGIHIVDAAGGQSGPGGGCQAAGRQGLD